MKRFSIPAAGLIRRTVLSAALLAVWIPGVSAQPRIETMRLSVAWPDVTVAFSATCDGQAVQSIDSSNVVLTENGIPVSSFRLQCPATGTRCAMSASLVFDVSGSMTGAGIAGTIAGGNAFIDEMDGVNDEACVLAFNQNVQMFQTMTNYRDLLRNAVNSMTAGGSTALWDGIYDGITELINSGVNLCRAVVVVSDGQDNASTHTLTEVVALANAGNIRVIAIALGDGADAALLKLVTQQTGGTFHATRDAAQLPAMYREIAREIINGFNECRATYTSTCADGTIRSVDITLSRLCRDSGSTSRQSYVAPGDSNGTVAIGVRVGSVTDSANTDIPVPVFVSGAGTQLVHPSIMTIRFDPGLVVPRGVDTRGTLLDGVPISMTAEGDSAVRIRTAAPAWIHGAGTLFTLVVLGVHRSDTACAPMRITEWSFEGGCLEPAFQAGKVCVTPSFTTTALSCETSVPTILPDTISGGYSPDPVLVTATVRNTGGGASDTVYARISLPAGCALAGQDAKNPIKRVAPPVLASGAAGTVSWQVAVTPVRVASSVIIPIDIYSSTGDTSRCEAQLDLPAVTLPDLAVSCQVPDTIHTGGGSPSTDLHIPVAVSVHQAGGPDAEQLAATLVLPAGIELVDAAEPLTKDFVPPSLHPGEDGGPLVWTVRPTGTVTADKFDFVWRIACRTPAGVADTIPHACSSIAGTRIRSIVCDVRTPDTLVTIGDNGLTNPSPFPVSVTVRNEGSSPVTVSDLLLDFTDTHLRLDPSTPERRTVNTILTAGDRLSASWLMLAVPGDPPPAVATFRVRCILLGDTIACARAVPHRNADARCDAFSDASVIHYDTVARAYQPISWSTRLVIANTGMLPLEEVRAGISFDEQGGGDLFELDASVDNNAPWKRIEVLMPGADSAVSWVVRLRDATPAADARRVCIRFSYSSFYIGDVLNGCERCVDVEGVGVLSVEPGAPSDMMLEQNHPNPVVGSATIAYRLPKAATARLALYDLLGREVRLLASGRQDAGRHILRFEAGGVPSGVYILRLDIPGAVRSRVMTVAR